ncbi:hypothetical protein HK405_014016, partial [Cladochytrium tenue]
YTTRAPDGSEQSAELLRCPLSRAGDIPTDAWFTVFLPTVRTPSLPPHQSPGAAGAAALDLTLTIQDTRSDYKTGLVVDGAGFRPADVPEVAWRPAANGDVVCRMSANGDDAGAGVPAAAAAAAAQQQQQQQPPPPAQPLPLPMPMPLPPEIVRARYRGVSKLGRKMVLGLVDLPPELGHQVLRLLTLDLRDVAAVARCCRAINHAWFSGSAAYALIYLDLTGLKPHSDDDIVERIKALVNPFKTAEHFHGAALDGLSIVMQPRDGGISARPWRFAFVLDLYMRIDLHPLPAACPTNPFVRILIETFARFRGADIIFTFYDTSNVAENTAARPKPLARATLADFGDLPRGRWCTLFLPTVRLPSSPSPGSEPGSPAVVTCALSIQGVGAAKGGIVVDGAGVRPAHHPRLAWRPAVGSDVVARAARD